MAVISHDSRWSKHEKTKARVISGTSNANVDFDELCSLLTKLGFKGRRKGSHRIFTKDGVDEIINLQPKNGKAKPYQVKQVRGVILKYRLAGDDE